MTTTWHTIEGKTFWFNQEKVREFCKQHFGPERKLTTNPITKRQRDNHGNWVLTSSGVLKFRYEKGLGWFVVAGGMELADPYSPFGRANGH